MLNSLKPDFFHHTLNFSLYHLSKFSLNPKMFTVYQSSLNLVIHFLYVNSLFLKQKFINPFFQIYLPLHEEGEFHNQSKISQPTKKITTNPKFHNQKKINHNQQKISHSTDNFINNSHDEYKSNETNKLN